MPDLLDFDVVNCNLAGLIDRQKSPAGAQAIFYPNSGGANYVIQIAFRGVMEREEDALTFLLDAVNLIRDGGRELWMRVMPTVSTETDHETTEKVTKGYARLNALEQVGDVHLPSMQERLETVRPASPSP